MMVEILSINFVIAFIFIGLVAYAGYTDLIDFKIENRISLSLLALFPAHYLATSQHIDLRFSLIAAAGIFVMCILLFALGKMGGGDVKLFSALALFCPNPDTLLMFVIVLTLFGITYGLVMLTDLRFVVTHQFSQFGIDLPLDKIGTKKVPMGIAFAFSAIVVISPLLLT